jgi:hypothetical protein
VCPARHAHLLNGSFWDARKCLLSTHLRRWEGPLAVSQFRHPGQALDERADPGPSSDDLNASRLLKPCCAVFSPELLGPGSRRCAPRPG